MSYLRGTKAEDKDFKKMNWKKDKHNAKDGIFVYRVRLSINLFTVVAIFFFATSG